VASYILVSLDTGEVIFEKDAHVQRTPASLTKLMTSYVALKYTDDLDGTQITCRTKHTDEVFLMGGSHADIRPGETVSMRNLIYAMLLPSANEAAKQQALLDIATMAKVIENESNIETLVKAKGFEECVAVINGEKASVIVKSEGLQPNHLSQILEIVYLQAGILPENVTIMEK
jgi:hypothetical protein